MYRKYAASDALNYIKICHLKPFQKKNSIKQRNSSLINLSLHAYNIPIGIFFVAILQPKYIYTNIIYLKCFPLVNYNSSLSEPFLHNTIYCTTKPNLNGESPGFIFLHQADGSSFSIIQRVRRNVSICLQMVQLRPNRGHRFKHLQRLLKTLCNLKLSLIYTCILSTPSF